MLLQKILNLKVKDYEDNSGDDSDKDSTWKPITNSVVFDKSNLNYLLYLIINAF